MSKNQELNEKKKKEISLGKGKKKPNSPNNAIVDGSKFMFFAFFSLDMIFSCKVELTIETLLFLFFFLFLLLFKLRR